MLGQESIVTKIQGYTLSTFPQTVLLVGKQGSGKHTLCNLIATQFNLMLEDISDQLTLEKIEEIEQRVSPYLYIIDSNKITSKEENVILKFLEEPLKNSFIILLCEEKGLLLETVVNRCQVWTLREYTKEQLRTFLIIDKEEELILSLSDTPGDIIKIQEMVDSLPQMFELTSKIVDKLNIASFPNALSIVDKLAFNHEKDKLDYLVFLKVLMYTIRYQYATNRNQLCLKMFNSTRQLLTDVLNKQFNAKLLVEHYIVSMWMLARGTSV